MKIAFHFCWMKKQELEDRLILFSIKIVKLTDGMPRTIASVNLIKQIIRSSSAPVLIYAEACAAESSKDFIHKMGIGLKELRETKSNLRMILMNSFATGTFIEELLDENEQLMKSINTARRNRLKR